MITESFLGVSPPFQSIIPSYVYRQYSDDADVQAFADTFNGLAQGYLDWFNQTPLAVYTSPGISGTLLDWVGQGVYGITRPVISSLTVSTFGSMNSAPMNTLAMNRFVQRRSGTAQAADDDIYKRVLTWHLYKGDGLQMTIQWLKRRVARFLYGINGSDIQVDDLQNISVMQPGLSSVGSLNTVAMNTKAMNTRVARTGKQRHALEITIPTSLVAQQFAVLLRENYLASPFQVRLSVALTS